MMWERLRRQQLPIDRVRLDDFQLGLGYGQPAYHDRADKRKGHGAVLADWKRVAQGGRQIGQFGKVNRRGLILVAEDVFDVDA